MSFLKQNANLPTTSAQANQTQISTYKDAEVIPFGYGSDRYGSHWLCQPFNLRTAYAGKGQPEYQYCSIAAGHALGPMDYVGRIWVNGEIVIIVGATRGSEDYIDFTVNAHPALGSPWTGRLYWGTETQTADAYLIAGTGQNHPARRGMCYIVWTNIDQGQGNTALPQIEVELHRHSPAVGSYGASGDHGLGVNPVAAIYGFLTDIKGGLGQAAIADAAAWGAQATALESIGVGGRTGSATWLHPTLSSQTDASTAISDILQYVDGFLRQKAGKLEFGWFPNNSPDESGLTEIAEADLDSVPSGGGFPDPNPISALTIVYNDWLREYQKTGAAAQLPVNRDMSGAPSPKRLDRPYIHVDSQAAAMAFKAGQVSGIPEITTTLKVLRSRAVNPDSTPLLPGDRFIWNYAPQSIELLCRVQERGDDGTSSTVDIALINERGAFPEPFIAPVDTRILPTPESPGTTTSSKVRIWFLPPGFGDARQIATLINRDSKATVGVKLYMSPSGSAPWSMILDERFFSAKCSVTNGGINNSVATVRVTSTSVDFARMAAQNAVAQTDDTLLLLIEDEVVSVGSITVVSTNTYDLGILRSRRGTAAAAHANGVDAWLFYRSEMVSVEHNEWLNVVDSFGVYNSTIATKHFEFQNYTAADLGSITPADPGISFIVPPLPAISAGSYTIALTSDAHTVACDSSGTPLSGELGSTGLAKTTVLAYLLSDPLIPVSSAPTITEFAIALGTVTGATASLSSVDTVEVDTLTANTATVQIIVSLYGGITITKVFTLTKTIHGTTGTTGNFVERRYKSSDLVPSTPVGDTPSGWSTTLPAPSGTTARWMVEGTKDASGHLVGVWSTPVRLDGLAVFYVHGISSITPSTNTLETGDIAFDLDDGDKVYSWDGSSWVSRQDGNIPSLISGLATETSNRTSADSTIASNLSTETASRISGDNTLSASISTETTARVSADGSLGAEYVLKTTTTGGGVTRVAGFRVTNYGGGGGSSDFIVQADNFWIVNDVGGSLKSPFNIVGGVTWIDDGVIRQLDVGKLTTGTLVASVSIGSGGSLSAGSGYNAFLVDGTTLSFGDMSCTNYGGVGTSLELAQGSAKARMNTNSGGAVIAVENSGSGGQVALFDSGDLNMNGTFYCSGVIQGNVVNLFDGGGGFKIRCGRNPSAGAFVGYCELICEDGTQISVPFYNRP